jgi:hypothetical protein
VEEAAAGAGESSSSSGDAEVLAGEASAEEITTNVSSWFGPRCFLSSVPASDVADIVVDGSSGPVGCEDITPPRIEFGEEGVVEAGALQAEVESADAAEGAAGDHGAPESRVICDAGRVLAVDDPAKIRRAYRLRGRHLCRRVLAAYGGFWLLVAVPVRIPLSAWLSQTRRV